ncbi:MAG TPA: methylated-DNA--[protein]-cysteine S-methyltransferase [Bryobacteraceae bacterium]|nr:methylated-DNA--[protein]-cysteine S-methyltransferase [Bryobacteraceae bacterium]
MLLHYDEFNSPIGRILFVSDGEAVCALDFAGYESRMEALLSRRYGQVEFQRGSDPLGLNQLLQRYFAGDLHAFEYTPVCSGGSAFQELVWKALRTIPVGKTWTYGQLAVRLRRPKAARAVGHANSLNPVAIIVPCHRVIGASSSLTGYAGGLERKQWLLRHEGALPAGFNLQEQRATA